FVGPECVLEDFIQNSKREQSTECDRKPVAVEIQRIRLLLQNKQDRFAEHLQDSVVKEVGIISLQPTPIHRHEYTQLYRGSREPQHVIYQAEMHDVSKKDISEGDARQA